MMRIANIRSAHSRKHSKIESPAWRLKSKDSSYSSGSSTESGDDATVTSSSSPASPEHVSSDSEVEQFTLDTLPIYPMMMLLRLGAAAAKQSSQTANSLGYATQRVAPGTCASPVASPTGWMARRMGNIDGDETVIRKARSLLNKLTIEKFESLYEQLATCGIKKTSQMRLLVREIFEKAAAQHHFIPMYADLCTRLESDSRVVSDEAAGDTRSSFRTLLLDACQTTFEELLDAQAKDPVDSDDEEYHAKRKHRAVGNVKFVGELLVRSMLGPRLLVACAESLLKARDECRQALESLACLLEVAAPSFDDKTWAHWQQLDNVFSQVKTLTQTESVPARERFLLRDVVELREAGWPGRSAATRKSGPMRLDDVRTHAETESSVSTPSEKCWRSLQQTPMPQAPAANESPKQAPNLTDTARSTPRPMGAEVKGPAPVVQKAFCPIGFRRALANVMKELAKGWNVPAAVHEIREQQVPKDRQAAEFADIITRAAEESRGPARRSSFAFAAGLAAAEDESAFDKEACLKGIGVFFGEVYQDLCQEVPRLPAIMKSELVPTLRSVLPEAKLREQVPVHLWTA